MLNDANEDNMFVVFAGAGKMSDKRELSESIKNEIKYMLKNVRFSTYS